MWDSSYMRVAILCLCISIFINGYTKGGEDKSNTSDLLKVYKVDKKVSDFPEGEDLSTPEAAYATIMRDYMATGASSAEWSKISTWSSEDTQRRNVSPDAAKSYQNARIIEVRIISERTAAVLAEITRDSDPPKFDIRFVELRDGRWLNRDQKQYSETLEEAREAANAEYALLIERPSQPKIENPQEYLEPFVEYLKKTSEEPKEFVMKALAGHKIVIMGEIHHRPRYWAFNSSLITEPNFPKRIGTIYLELPSNDQGLVDKFLASGNCDTMPVIEMLRDNLWMGWPDQPMLDFFMTVWIINQNLEPSEQIRIVLVDQQRPWSQIKKQQDWGPYTVNRDKFMAENIVKDIREHPEEKRNRLFIVGVGHTSVNFEYFKDAPVMTAGWYLRQKLGPENVYAVFQHRCVQTNMGRVDGRLCLGLFETAFAALGNQPMAFSLQSGPFGEERYDADPDVPVSSKYKDGFDAYLYLGPLETEIQSPLIAGFYTDEFVQELERRFKLTNGKGWAETYGLDKSDAETFIKWMVTWGKPRWKWQLSLGPLDAWHYGDQWQKIIQEERLANVRYEELTAELDKIVQGIKEIAPAMDWEAKFGFSYQAASGYDAMYTWWCDVTKEHPFESVKYGDLRRNPQGLPTINVTITLQGEIILSRDFVFRYIPLEQRWQSRFGLDFHLDPKWRNLPERKEIVPTN